MTVFIHKYIQNSSELEIRSCLMRQIYSVSNALYEENGEVRLDESKLQKIFPHMYLAVFDDSGNLKTGTMPSGDACVREKQISPQKLQVKDHVYYYMDRELKEITGWKEFVRSYVDKADIDKKYMRIKIGYYSGVIVCLLLLIMLLGVVSFQIKATLENMKKTVDRIGTGQDLDYRLDPNTTFKELHALIEADNRMLDRLQEMFQQQEQFTSDVAHELRTPVSVIKLQAQQVLNNYDITDEVRHSFEVILRQSNKMADLIQNLLELSRLEQGSLICENEWMDLNDIVCVVCENEEENLQHKNIEIKFESKETLETRGDIALITIAISNIIVNAVKYSKEGGSVYVQTGKKNDFVFVEVKDEGVGMTPEDAKNIFKRFYKVDASRNSDGYGLGMAITQKIVELHNGVIQVESVLGKGSSFTIFLPKKGDS